MRIAIDTNRYVDFAKGLPEAVERLRRVDEILVPLLLSGRGVKYQRDLRR